MKKLKLSLQDFANIEVLTRDQLKNIIGGSGGTGGTGVCNWGPCKVMVQQGASWVEKNGSCTYAMRWNTPGTCYCETGAGELPVTSNGGVSRCNP